MTTKQYLSSKYRSFNKENCCEPWLEDRNQFYEWYDEQLNEQKERCIYCHLPGDTKEYYQDWFRKGKRGQRLEVDRRESKEPYSPENCVLACYPCNNAKSDVFSYDEFVVIGKAIRKAKRSSQST